MILCPGYASSDSDERCSATFGSRIAMEDHAWVQHGITLSDIAILYLNYVFSENGLTDKALLAARGRLDSYVKPVNNHTRRV